MTSRGPILPGRTVGILGGGQLGRMFAIAARRMGYRVHALDPSQDGPAGQVADVEVVAPYEDVDAARRFAEAVDVVTFEFENVPSETLAAVAERRPVYPSPAVLDTCRHRLREKRFLAKGGFPVAGFAEIRTEDELRAALVRLGTPAILKTAEFGYDGKGQVRIDAPESAGRAFQALGGKLGVLEAFVPFACELSVVVARSHEGDIVPFEVAENRHARHILDVSLAPAGVPAAARARATEVASDIAKAIDLVGVLGVEMFYLPNGDIVVNELAPRPHNSGHYTFDACVTSQFEQQLRAVCGLPLGEPTLLRPAAMANLLGDLWEHGEPQWDRAAAFPDVKIHLYGKTEARPGRKMGHLVAMAETAEKASARVLAARSALVSGRPGADPGP
ncbi:5-(carboxyamino)imidazole ribonucleotide synthase [Polyangium mundeleinium]|uniref:N5-carboxyaminoimidazole ribonucleotide synthase n=1 Tax=Polyangium mundeleinium TaxID=2995306 RepID=A0ABT5EJF5_9BACT|nr:5-(carboxyamino)imidazole ribonucleotide synthase [Polyangium mundeleinium]MDC0741962.1 5-(carboxyamino)imidazole ribonucleotide synthase [Polyangium mundeleinium]